MRFACCVVLCALVVMPTLASAGPTEDAKATYDRGTALFALQKYAEAAALYEQAFATQPNPAILYNAAQAQRLAGNKERALTLYENCLQLYASQLKAYRTDIKLHISDLRAQIAAAATPVVVPAPSPSTTTQPTMTLTEAPPAPERRPLVKRAWFWGAVAGGVVIAGAAVALGVVFGTRSSPPTATFGTAKGN